MNYQIISFIGFLTILGLCYLLSRNKKAIRWKTVLWGVAIQFSLALLILKTPGGKIVFDKAKDFFNIIFGYSLEGSKFVFGPLVKMDVTSAAFGPANAFLFAFQVSSTIIFVSALMAVLYHLGVMQRIVYIFAYAMQKLMQTTGAESLSAAANIFMGQTEAPLVVRPYIDKMTRSEIMAMMTGGMATVAGAVLAAYASFGIDAGHLLAASVMNAPASLVIAKLLLPETEQSETAGKIPSQTGIKDANVLDAACRGAGEGLQLALNVTAMLIAFIALVACLNGLIGWVTSFLTDTPLSIQIILGYLFSPFAFLMGVPKEDILSIGSILGIKTTLNEFVAYVNLSEQIKTLNPRSVILATYALCGFANFGSIAIQIGGIGALVPARRADLAKYGFLAMVGGTLASFMTACLAGILIG